MGIAYIIEIRNRNGLRRGTEEESGLISRTGYSRMRRRRESLVQEKYQKAPEVMTKKGRGIGRGIGRG